MNHHLRFELGVMDQNQCQHQQVSDWCSRKTFISLKTDLKLTEPKLDPISQDASSSRRLFHPQMTFSQPGTLFIAGQRFCQQPTFRHHVTFHSLVTFSQPGNLSLPGDFFLPPNDFSSPGNVFTTKQLFPNSGQCLHHQIRFSPLDNTSCCSSASKVANILDVLVHHRARWSRCRRV